MEAQAIPATDVRKARIFRFGIFEVDSRTGELRRNGMKIRLQTKAWHLLVLLLQRAGQVVTREELRNGLWPADTFVDFDANIKTALTKLRQALGDSAENPVFIETVPRVGYRFISPVSVAETDIPVTPANSDSGTKIPSKPEGQPAPLPKTFGWKTQAAICAALVMVIAVTIFVLHRRPSASSAPSSRSMVLLVQPFDNLSGDASQEFFSDGLTDEMITLLGERAPQGLSVIAWTSAMRYRNTQKPPAQIARELGGADYVLEGSVRRSGSHTAINAQLFRIRDQAVLWAQTYDSETPDVLATQQDVAERISRSLFLKLMPPHSARPAIATVDPSVHDAYLMGLYEANKRTEDGLRSSIQYFQEAIQKGPEYAPAYAALANSYLVAAGWLILKPGDGYPKAKVAALRALELDPNLAEAHATLAEAEHIYEWKWAEAEKEYRSALELNPSSSLAHKSYAEFLMHSGRKQEAIAEINRARDLDPLSLIIGSLAGFVYAKAGQYDRAIQESQRVLQLDPQFAPAHYFLGGAFLREGRYDDAIAQFQKARASSASTMMVVALIIAEAKSGRRQEAQRMLAKLQSSEQAAYVCPYGLAQIYATLGQRDHALDSLDRAVTERSFELMFLRADQSFDNLREEPRFAHLMEKIGFPAENAALEN